MPEYEFELVMEGRHELTDNLADALFEAGCDDGTPATINGVLDLRQRIGTQSDMLRLWRAVRPSS